MPLARSHALAFATAAMTDDELKALETQDPQPMYMKREQRVEGWEIEMPAS